MFYDGCLRDGVTAEQREPMVDWLPTLCVVDVDAGNEECGSDGSFFNTREVEVVLNLIVKLLEGDVEANQIGVITHYKSQGLSNRFPW